MEGVDGDEDKASVRNEKRKNIICRIRLDVE